MVLVMHLLVTMDKIIEEITHNEIPNSSFWHEKNSLFFLDRIETLEGSDGCQQNMNLTYTVRDGIAWHCGEVNEIQ
jgi:dGTPase